MDELRLDGCVAIVTGAGRGIGRAHALLLAQRGASVIVNDPGGNLAGDGKSPCPAQDVVDEIVAAGGVAQPNFSLVADEAGVHAMVGQALEAFGRIDIAINNAGNFLPRHSFEQTTAASFEKIWQVHLMGTVHVIRAVWPHMKAQGYGRIVNTASHTALLGSRDNIEYSAAKGAIFGLTKTLALESQDYGIAVNAIAPGGITRPVKLLENLVQQIPEGAFEPALVAPTVLWLSHESCAANGEVFGVMSGTTSRIKVGETSGYFSRNPTPESIAEACEELMGEPALQKSGLIFAEQAELRGLQLIQHYTADR